MRGDRFTNKCIFRQSINKQKIQANQQNAALALCSGLLGLIRKNKKLNE